MFGVREFAVSFIVSERGGERLISKYISCPRMYICREPFGSCRRNRDPLPPPSRISTPGDIGSHASISARAYTRNVEGELMRAVGKITTPDMYF